MALDRQAIFNKVVDHLLKQNKKAQTRAPNEIDYYCTYLAEDGSRCAIGCLIPDGHPGLHLKGDASTLDQAYPDLFMTTDDGHDLRFLRQLQICHDQFEVFEWPKRLRVIGASWNLTLPDSIKESNVLQA